MTKAKDFIFDNLIRLMTLAAVLPLLFVIIFIIGESLPLFKEVPLSEFLFGTRWMPTEMTGTVSFGIFNFIAATLAVSLLAMLFAIIIGVGTAVFLSCASGEKTRAVLYPFIDLLAGIPSVIYGFVGLVVLVPLFRRAGVHVGTCVLCGAILLSVMLLPFLISSCSDTMVKMKDRYMPSSDAMGIDRWYAIATMILPASAKQILLTSILAVGRAMGETMAVMMVVGNANLFPAILGKSETIASLIALEMGTAEVGSLHYHALYASGMVLLVLVCAINTTISYVSRRLEREESGDDIGTQAGPETAGGGPKRITNVLTSEAAPAAGSTGSFASAGGTVCITNVLTTPEPSSGAGLDTAAPGPSELVTGRRSGIRGLAVKVWSLVSLAATVGAILFLFIYIFINGKDTISIEFLTASPGGAVLGSEGGIFPAIIGSFWFTGVAVITGGIPAIALAVYKCFYCTNKKTNSFLSFIIKCTAGIPSIVLGLFSYSFMVKELEVGRCILSAGVALGIMVLPFIETRVEKAFSEVPQAMIESSYALGCSKAYTFIKVVLPACIGEIVSALILGGCFACGATAPLIFTGGVAFARLPESVMSKAMAMPLHLYLLVAQGATSLPMAYGTAFVMMAVLLLCSFIATIISRYIQVDMK